MVDSENGEKKESNGKINQVLGNDIQTHVDGTRHPTSPSF
jgi:hypothetical protein